MIYLVKIKTINGVYTDYSIDYPDFNIDDEVPCMISYRGRCSTTWSEAKQNQWWEFIDVLLQQENIPVSDFVLAWNVTYNGTVFGNENEPPQWE